MGRLWVAMMVSQRGECAEVEERRKGESRPGSGSQVLVIGEGSIIQVQRLNFRIVSEKRLSGYSTDLVSTLKLMRMVSDELEAFSSTDVRSKTSFHQG